MPSGGTGHGPPFGGMELYTPELYKRLEFIHWQPKLVNHIHFLRDTERDFCTPLVAHTD